MSIKACRLVNLKTPLDIYFVSALYDFDNKFGCLDTFCVLLSSLGASGTQLVAGRLSAVRANRLARDGWRLKTSSSSSCWRHRFALARDVALVGTIALRSDLLFSAMRFAPTRFREGTLVE